MNRDQLEKFLIWFRARTERYWENHTTQSLENFGQRGVGGGDWRQGTHWKNGLSEIDIDRIEANWGVAFPKDYRAFLSILNAPTKKQASFRWSKDAPSRLAQVADRPSFFDWENDHEHIRSALDQPLNGIFFDVENNALWLAAWGERPATPDQRKRRLEQLIKAAPALIPIFGRRYLLDYELPTGRPVLSIHQSDIIIYGEDLADYLVNDFRDLLSEIPASMAAPTKIDMQKVAEIPFWGTLIG
ncbi:hypothetical protein A9Q96_04775 [Rhodobacterales bacterium 52_120_T64]|nr:hypothetical protein A9Q96_04775 [Rhodobacterales bacterium 52_120_T64]